MTVMADTFVAEAERLAARRRESDPGWLVGTRRAALERFDRLGFPTPRDEEWRFTNVAPIAEGRFAPAEGRASFLTGAASAAVEWRGDRLATLVFVNGRHVSAASEEPPLPPGVRVESLARLLSRPESEAETHLTRIANGDGHAFTALNTAFLADGATLEYPIALDPTHDALRKYGVQGLPMTAVIDKRGVVRFAELGVGKLQRLERAIAALLL